MKRWLVALLGIALAVAAFLALATGRRAALSAKSRTRALPHAEIDDASRAQLERVIRDSEREESHSK